MRVNSIENVEGNFASIVIGYKIYQSTKLNSVLSRAIHVAYRMVKEDVFYDLSEMLKSKLVANNNKVKQEKKLFKFGAILVCICFYLPLFSNKRHD